MSIRDKKITDIQIKEKGVCAAPDTLNGTAAENKGVFDRLIREIVAPQFNEIVDTFADMEESAQSWDEAEKERVAAEEQRNTREGVRILHESARERSESSRDSAETARKESENARNEAETLRATAESNRNDAEIYRNVAENDRNDAEVTRVIAEENRTAAEKTRATAESNRNDAEIYRDSAENARISAEEKREAFDTVCRANESTRRTQESERKEQESWRVEAENARVTAEKNRADAENSRITAEKNRVDETNGVVARASEFASAAAASQTEAGKSATAAQTAQTAAEAAQQQTTADAAATAEARKIVESAADAETARVEAEKGRVAAEAERVSKDAERDGKISKIADELSATQQTVGALADRFDALDVLFKFPRTGKVYTVKIPKFAANPTTVCEKLDDNAGLVCEASTDTVEGRDDYAELPLFRWYNCNYLRDERGHAYPTAIEGISDGYTTTGSVDVGVIQMAPYCKWEDHDDYNILSITDTPREGYQLWCEAVSNGKEYPYVIHSKYFSGVAADGLMRSQPDLVPARNNSYQSIIANYAKKGAGYFGALDARNTWQIIFTLIKYATKSSQNVFAGCTAYNSQYAAALERAEKLTYFPLTKAQAQNIIVGSRVSVGYGSLNGSTVNNDRETATIHKYCDCAKVLKIEDLDETNSAVYLDVADGFDTTPIPLSDAINAPIMLSTMHWAAGSTDAVIGHHDGSLTGNRDYKHPYRVQGVEYAVGGYFLGSDVVMDIQSNYDKNVLVAPAGAKRESSDVKIRENYTNIGTILGNNGTEYWIGDIAIDLATGVTYPCAFGAGDRTGIGDSCWIGGAATSGTREFLKGGRLWLGSAAGSAFLDCWSGLTGAYWHYLAAD